MNFGIASEMSTYLAWFESQMRIEIGIISATGELEISFKNGGSISQLEGDPDVVDVLPSHAPRNAREEGPLGCK